MKNKKDIYIGIIGLGYVGLPLAVEFSKFFKTIGFDKSRSRVNELKDNFDKTKEILSEDLKKTKLKYTFLSSDILNCNIYIIAVPTPVDKDKIPDLRYLTSASKMVAKFINVKSYGFDPIRFPFIQN